MGCRCMARYSRTAGLSSPLSLLASWHGTEWAPRLRRGILEFISAVLNYMRLWWICIGAANRKWFEADPAELITVHDRPKKKTFLPEISLRLCCPPRRLIEGKALLTFYFLFLFSSIPQRIFFVSRKKTQNPRAFESNHIKSRHSSFVFAKLNTIGWGFWLDQVRALATVFFFANISIPGQQKKCWQTHPKKLSFL